MASQPLYQPYSPPAPFAVCPNIRVVFSNGAAARAVQHGLADMPAGVREATLEEIAIAEQTRAFIAQSAAVCSPRMHSALLEWGPAAFNLETAGSTDEEAEEHLRALGAAFDLMKVAHVTTVSDAMIQAYLAALEATGNSSCIGPARDLPVGDTTWVSELGQLAAASVATINPLCGMLRDLAIDAWRASGGSSALSPRIGAAIAAEFNAAKASELAGVGHTSRLPLSAPEWDHQLQTYQAARAKSEACPLDHPDVDTLCDVSCEMMDHLIERVPARDLQDVVIKINLALERADGFVDELFADHARGIIADVKRLAAEQATTSLVHRQPEQGA